MDPGRKQEDQYSQAKQPAADTNEYGFYLCHLVSICTNFPAFGLPVFPGDFRDDETGDLRV